MAGMTKLILRSIKLLDLQPLLLLTIISPWPLEQNGEGNSFFEFADDGGHAVEVGASVDVANASLFLGRFVSGATKEDTYAELSYPLSDDFSLVLGVGDGALAAEGDFALVNAGLAITGDSGYGASFTVNPDAETAFFVVSKSW